MILKSSTPGEENTLLSPKRCQKNKLKLQTDHITALSTSVYVHACPHPHSGPHHQMRVASICGRSVWPALHSLRSETVPTGWFPSQTCPGSDNEKTLQCLIGRNNENECVVYKLREAGACPLEDLQRLQQSAVQRHIHPIDGTCPARHLHLHSQTNLGGAWLDHLGFSWLKHYGVLNDKSHCEKKKLPEVTQIGHMGETELHKPSSLRQSLFLTAR